ncbi:MAG: AMP-binding protein, partial [Chloroflexi bacterium]|nr:AMP-binding protein [Chloroflexota bacterium]
MEQEFTFGGEIVWRATPEQMARTRLRQFMDAHGIATFDELLARSTQDIGWFWEAVLNDLRVEFYEPYTQIVDLSRGLPWAQWCVGGKMNAVHNALDKWMGTPTDSREAIRWEGEDGATRVLTYRELYREVNRLANGLRALGLRKGDPIGLFLPMAPEVAVALLAIAKIGAIVLPLFSGYGSGALVTRLNDAGAKALICADGFPRRGNIVSMKAVADEALAQSPTVEHCIVLRHAGNAVVMNAERDHWYDELVSAQSDEAETERTSAEDTLFIVYTSGTTGKPKGAVHTHVGFPVKATQDMVHGLDLREGDVFWWMTDIGWVMGPLLVLTSLFTGATMFLFDGAPDYPEADRVWAMVER